MIVEINKHKINIIVIVIIILLKLCLKCVKKESCYNNNSGNHSNVIKNIIVEMNKHKINIIVIIIIVVSFKTLFKMW